MNRLASSLVLISWCASAQQPLPRTPPPQPPALVELGQTLFFDPRLSANGTLSCASCHDVLGPSGADGLPVSVGIEGRRGARNAPTVWNAGLRSALFWDGRAASLEAQAGGPVLNPVEMGMPDEAAVARRLAPIAGYQPLFVAAFGDPEPTFSRVVAALAAFERTLLTPDSPFDAWLRGEAPLAPRAARGWETFRRLGCIGCHGTPTFGRDDYFLRFPLRSVPEVDFVLGVTRDRGRGAVTGLPRDDNRWRIPSLRNVAVTAPYFHNGSVATLEQAVRLMGRAQLARTLSDDEVSDVVAFLGSLTGRRPSLTAPRLPR